MWIEQAFIKKCTSPEIEEVPAFERSFCRVGKDKSEFLAGTADHVHELDAGQDVFCGLK
jgi:hypothetical protein